MPNCEICGEPMPPGEEMFMYHGASGDCPKPPLPDVPVKPTQVEVLRAALVIADEAINPPDRAGISLDAWNLRLKAATETIRSALRHEPRLEPEKR